MRDVYTHSVCNISATSASDNSSGFLGMLDEPIPLPPRVQPTWAPQVGQSFGAVDAYFWWAQLLNMPLDKRGWVFQERFLAPRVLHFGTWQMLWECATHDACEMYPMGLPPESQPRNHTHFKRFGMLERLISQQEPSSPTTCMPESSETRESPAALFLHDKSDLRDTDRLNSGKIWTSIFGGNGESLVHQVIGHATASHGSREATLISKNDKNIRTYTSMFEAEHEL